jgi:hypothetical protein
VEVRWVLHISAPWPSDASVCAACRRLNPFLHHARKSSASR